MNVLIALDLSTKSTGVAVFEDGVLKKSVCLEAAGNDLVDRIFVIKGKLRKIFDEYVGQTVTIAAEEVRPSGSMATVQTHRALMWMQAAAIFEAHEAFEGKAKISYINPNTWRATLGIKTGRGIKRDALKQADLDWVNEKYYKDSFAKCANDDIADAICLGEAVLKGGR